MRIAAIALLVIGCSQAPAPVADQPPPAHYANVPFWEKGSPIQPPKVLERVEPRYPLEVVHAVKNGSVKIGLLIRENGSVADAWYINGDRRLARVAIQAMVGWRFAPATLDGKPIAVRTEITTSMRSR